MKRSLKFSTRLTVIIFVWLMSFNTLNAQWIQTNGPCGGTVQCFLAVSGTNLFAGTLLDGVYLSTNNGTSWTAVNSGFSKNYNVANVHSLAVSGTNLFAGTGGGVYLSTNNGTSWDSVNTGLTNTYVSALAVSGTNLFAGTAGGGVFLSTNNGTSGDSV
ncbi:MAG TPA: regulator, partial [Ignavibacteria bacterium]